MAAPDRTTEHEGASLKRVISRRMLVLFIVGDIRWRGIYALTGKVAGEAGGAIWVPFLAAFLLAAMTATAYPELVGEYPQAAGAALYTHKAFRRSFLTFLVAFAVLMSGITSASAAAWAFGGDYLAEFVDLPTHERRLADGRAGLHRGVSASPNSYCRIAFTARREDLDLS
jgi:amino acid transporter